MVIFVATASSDPTVEYTLSRVRWIRLRDELLNGEILYTLREAQIVIESWRRHYNTSGPTPQSDTSHQHQRCSCPHSPRGRLRSADRLRRPRWRNDQP
jgi:hypothetical protein